MIGMTKKMIAWISVFVAVLTTVSYVAYGETMQQDIGEKLIRLHVLANSDSDTDQAVKLLVRDAVLVEAERCLAGAENREAAAEQLRAALPQLESVAEAVAMAEGTPYPVTAELSMEQYPRRQYDTFALPAGEYLSLRLFIGEGAGQNWWCVVYPPLCTAATTEEFYDRAETADFTAEEIHFLTEEPTEMVIRCKLFDTIKGFFS